jgi:hypothetical protein
MGLRDQIDGYRVQLHIVNEDVRIFTRGGMVAARPASSKAFSWRLLPPHVTLRLSRKEQRLSRGLVV